MRDDVRHALNAFAQQKADFWKNATRGVCPECSTEDVILNASARNPELPAVCADCARTRSVRDTAYPCDDCGGGPAFRDPAGREDDYRCHSCHEKGGYVPGERSMVSRMMKREGVTHSQGRRDPCIIDVGTEHGG